MAGLWNLSFQQLHDLNGLPYPGAKAYFYAADSLIPITVYQDYGLGTAHSNPVVADGNGVFPAVFFDETDEFYRQRMTTSGGTTIGRTDLTVVPIIGPSGGGGGSEVPVDANALFQTGDLLWLDSSGTRAGWVRDNGRTIGSASSGATERANADCEQLFLFGWAKGWTVTGGAGASAAADWAANKPIALPDKRFKTAVGLADMGNTALSISGTVPFGTGNSTTAGSIGGEQAHTLSTGELPSITPSGTVSAPTITSTVDSPYTLAASSGFGAASGSGAVVGTGVNNITISSSSSAPTFAGNSFGGGSGHNNMQPFVLGTFYRKL